MSTNLPPPSRFIHTFLSGSNLPQVIGQLQNLSDVGRSLVSFRWSENLFSLISVIFSFISFFILVPSIHTEFELPVYPGTILNVCEVVVVVGGWWAMGPSRTTMTCMTLAGFIQTKKWGENLIDLSALFKPVPI